MRLCHPLGCRSLDAIHIVQERSQMSANAANTPVRRPVAPTRPAGAPVARERAPVAAIASFDADDGEEFRLNLSDIPRLRESLVVEGLKPTLLSRFFDLIMPLKA
jgi:hypothetical protein